MCHTMKRVIPLLPFIWACLASCVRTDVPAQCPDATSLTLFVQDKNYAGAAALRDENLSFASYISGVYYVLHNLQTGEEIASGGYLSVTGTAAEYPISLDGLPAGQYLLTAWGNLPGITTISATGAELHAAGGESTDIYRGSQVVDLRPGHEQAYRVGMQRTKGLLEIECVDFPSSISHIEVSFGTVYARDAADGSYAGSATVAKSFPFGNGNPTLLAMRLAPTPGSSPSNFTVSLYETNNPSPFFVFPTNGLTIARNTVTRVRLNYNLPGVNLELWVMIDGEWVRVNYMNL